MGGMMSHDDRLFSKSARGVHANETGSGCTLKRRRKRVNERRAFSEHAQPVLIGK